jgi:hypothetical protein
MISSRIAVCATLAAICLAGGSLLGQRAGSIDTIAPAAARPGDSVTITGRGFGAINVRVTVGGVPADVLAATGSRVTFRVPTGAAPGSTHVIATNPGGQSGSIAFRVIEGVLLTGSASQAARDASSDLLGTGAIGADIVNGVILNRLEVRFRFDATVGQVNAALLAVNGGIIGMQRGLTSFTIAVPRASSVDELRALTNVLSSQPGVVLAVLAQIGEPQIVAVDPIVTAELVTIRHLLPSRFPAAWNAVDVDLFAHTQGQCPIAPIQIVVGDWFGAEPLPGFTDVVTGFHPAAAPRSGLDPFKLLHGYYTTEVIAQNDLGANPFGGTHCLDIHLVQLAGMNLGIETAQLAAGMPAGKFILNYSMGFAGECNGPCVPSTGGLHTATQRAQDALLWKESTKARWPEFLAVVAAGNANHEEASNIYRGAGDARYGTQMAIGQLADPLFHFATEDGLWTPSAGFQALGFQSIAASPGSAAGLAEAVHDKGLDGPDATADNVIVVGSIAAPPFNTLKTQHPVGGSPLLPESTFSNANADILAVGEGFFGVNPEQPDDPNTLRGTSLAAPIVSGLASFLWMVDPDLRSAPASMTKRAIVANANNRVVDAYASVLSLDAPGIPNPSSAPVRLTLLNVNGANGFEEGDIDTFLHYLFVTDGPAPHTGNVLHQPAPGVEVDFSRYDLNGDGFTTAGEHRERFDLDRVNSERWGASVYSSVTETIHGHEFRFNEEALTDIEILCYYAYSPLYTGNPDARDDMLTGRCGISIEPSTVTLPTGAQQQFTAHTPDNGAVTWSATGGTITGTGLFTAGSTPGTSAVRVTSVADANVFAEATVTITGTSNIAAIFIDSVGLNVGRSRTITAIAVDADGNEVTVAPSAWSWSIDPIGIASLSPSGNRATLTGLSQGTATLTVSLPSAGLTAISTVMVNNLIGTYQGTVTRITSNGEEALAGHVQIYLFDGHLAMDVSLVVFGNIDIFVPIATNGTSFSGSDRSYNWAFTVSPSGGTLSGTGTHTSAPLSWRVEVVKVN